MDPVVIPLDLSDIDVASQVLKLQRAAYRLEADLIGFEGIPPLHETFSDLRSALLTWRGTEKDGSVVGAIAFIHVDGVVDIDRLVVAPAFVRQGYGRALVASLTSSATITVSTGTDNAPAHGLYQSLGFVRVGESSPVAGLAVTHFERRPENEPF